MNSRTTRRFRDLLGALPSHVRAQARDAYALFRQDPSHPGLHFKKVYPDPPMYSARVGIGRGRHGRRYHDLVLGRVTRELRQAS